MAVGNDGAYTLDSGEAMVSEDILERYISQER